MMKTPEQQRLALEIADAAWELDDDAVGAWLEARCAGNPSLLKEVSSLLEADGRSPCLPETLDEQMVGRLQDWLSSTPPRDRQVGGYRLLEQLNSGDMADVYKAERADGSTRKVVAVKVLRRRLHGGQARARLLAERQILSGLDHPNIARLLDVGTTDDSRPYFVMEWVDGLPIDHFCETEGLGLEARLRLLCDLCSAVHYAHQRFIVHRDLKPANILVDVSGRLKLLDFGIAKSLAPTALGDSVRTSTGQRPMTVAFASPEQILGGDITTGTDVHGLGLIMFLLLCGDHPFELQEMAVHDLADAICRRPIPRPSRFVEGTSGGRKSVLATARDASQLDAVVLKALEKDPRSRYASAEQLRQEVENYLHLRPVTATPPGWLRGLSLAVRRNRAVSSVIAASVVMLALFVASLAHQMRRTEDEAAKAERERLATQRASEFMTGIFAVLDQSYGESATVTARQLLDTTYERARSELAEEQEVQFRVLAAVGVSYRDLGLVESSIPVLRHALRLGRQIHGQQSKETATLINDLAYSHWQNQEIGVAGSLLHQAYDIAVGAGFTDGEPIATSVNGLGIVAYIEGDWVAAEAFFRRALRLRSEAPEPDPGAVASCLDNLGIALEKQGLYPEAREYTREALALRIEQFGPEHHLVASTMNNLANIEKYVGSFEESISLYRRAIEIWETVHEPASPRILGAMHNIAGTYIEAGELDAAEEVLDRTLALHEEKGSTQTHWYGASHLTRGILLEARERWPAAKQSYETAYAVLKETVGPAHPRTAKALAGLGAILLQEGDQAGGYSLLETAYADLVATLGEDHIDVVEFCGKNPRVCST